MFVSDILQPTHLLLLLVVALVVLGPKRLPEAARSVGRSINSFRSAVDEDPAKLDERVTRSEAGEPAEPAA